MGFRLPASGFRLPASGFRVHSCPIVSQRSDRLNRRRGRQCFVSSRKPEAGSLKPTAVPTEPLQGLTQAGVGVVHVFDPALHCRLWHWSPSAHATPPAFRGVQTRVPASQ